MESGSPLVKNAVIVAITRKQKPMADTTLSLISLLSCIRINYNISY